jgi:hypothetical protein
MWFADQVMGSAKHHTYRLPCMEAKQGNIKNLCQSNAIGAKA